MPPLCCFLATALFRRTALPTAKQQAGNVGSHRVDMVKQLTVEESDISLRSSRELSDKNSWNGVRIGHEFLWRDKHHFRWSGDKSQHFHVCICHCLQTQLHLDLSLSQTVGLEHRHHISVLIFYISAPVMCCLYGGGGGEKATETDSSSSSIELKLQ